MSNHDAALVAEAQRLMPVSSGAGQSLPTPAAPAAERSLLGAVLIRPTLFADFAADLHPEEFFTPAHRTLWEAMGALERRRMAIDPASLEDELQARGELARLPSGADYLMTLAGGVPVADRPRAEQWAADIRSTSNLRKILALCAEMSSRIRGEGIRDAEALECLTADLAKVGTGGKAGFTRIGDHVVALLEDFDVRRNRPVGTVTGIRSGLRNFDAVTCGLDPGDLVVVAADPGGGKTAFAMQVAHTLCVEDHGSAIVFNLEMPEVQLAERSLVHGAKVNSQTVRNGELTYEQVQALQAAGAALYDVPLYVEDDVFHLRDVLKKARAWRAMHPAPTKGLVIVDFVQLMRGDDDSRDSRAREIGKWVAALKELAKKLKVAVIVVSQFNRTAGAEGKRPTMRNLKESGDIEQAADTIVLIHNPENTSDGAVDLILDKNRKGPKAVLKARWIGRYYRFETLDSEPEQQELPAA